MTDERTLAPTPAPAPAASSPAAHDGAAPAPAAHDAGDVELLALIDRLADLLDRSDLSELEVEAGGTGVVLRKPIAVAVVAAGAATPMPGGAVESSARFGGPAAGPGGPAAGPGGPAAGPGEPSAAGRDPAASAPPSIKAPLTGIFYASPAPGTAPYVSVGGEVAVGQIIGLIEAMKLFNEIKSDLAGRVTRVVPESGALVKAKQPLIEVEPL